jgi:hypothetical protein
MGRWLANVVTDSSGFYQARGLADGTYFVVAHDADYLNEVYDDNACIPGCAVTSGTPVTAALGTVTTGIDFALARLGAISGTVTETGSGDPITSGIVEARSVSTGALYSDGLDSLGQYRIERLPPGTYYVATKNATVHADEVWDDVPCPPGGCAMTVGTPVTASLDSTTTGIDFALELGGVVTGIVTNAVGGEPLDGVDVRLYDHLGVSIDSVSTDSSGVWRIEGLAAGTYFATARAKYGYVAGLYDGLFCGEEQYYGCDPTTGTPIAVTTGTTTSGVDFSLTPLGAVSGAVTDAVTGAPVADIRIEIFLANGIHLRYGTTNASGQYTVEGIPSGDYFVRTNAWGGPYMDELYDDILCYGCDPTSGTPVPVTLATTTSGIDFSLERYGGISGSISDAETGELITNTDILVQVWNPDLRSNSVASQITWDGTYAISSLYPGTYYISARPRWGGSYLTEVYDDIACAGEPPSYCDVSKGQPIVVTTDTMVTGIDFNLRTFFSGIRATVTDAGSGAPLPWVQVDIWSDSGYLVDSVVTDDAGSCLVPLDDGTYYLSTHNTLGYTDEVYNDLLCPSGSAFMGGCDPVSGEPVVVNPYQVTEGIAFALGREIFSDSFESGDTTRWSVSIR